MMSKTAIFKLAWLLAFVGLAGAPLMRSGECPCNAASRAECANCPVAVAGSNPATTACGDHDCVNGPGDVRANGTVETDGNTPGRDAPPTSHSHHGSGCLSPCCHPVLAAPARPAVEFFPAPQMRVPAPRDSQDLPTAQTGIFRPPRMLLPISI